MYTQMKNAASKIHSIHVLPKGSGFSGKIEVVRQNSHSAFSPKPAASVTGKLALTGAVTVKPPPGQRRVADNVTAPLLATQGSIPGPPPMPRQFSEFLKPPVPAP